MTTPTRRIVGAALAVTALAGASLTGIAAPAQAAVNHTITWDCTSNDIAVEANVGDTLTFAAPGVSCPGAGARGTDPDDSSVAGFTTWGGGLLNWTLSAGSADQVTIVSANLAASIASGKTIAWMDNTVIKAKIVITIVEPAPDRELPASSNPAPVHQGLPMPASGSCADVKDADYAWGTGLAGGWQKSWQPWVNAGEGKGGWACARTLVYAGNAWSVQA